MDRHVFGTTDEAARYGEDLLTDRHVTLRAATDQDFSTLSTWWNSPTVAALQQGVIRPAPDATAEEMFRSWSSNRSGTLDTGFAITLHDTGELIGHLTLYGPHTPARTATFAIIIGPPFVGQGYGPRATRLMLRYGFYELGLHRIELHVWAFNTRAIAAYQKAGFTVEGRRRDAGFHAGEFHDDIVMAILSTDYAD
jgi:RimJ/RimL family protein N-acetyltransferase